jgi:serine protease
MEQARSTPRTILKFYVAAILIGTGVSTAAAAPIYPQQAASPQFVNYANRVTAYVDSVDRLIVKYKDVSPDSNESPELPTVTSDRLARLQRSAQHLGLRIKVLHTIATGGHVLKLPTRLRIDEMRALARLIEYLDPNVEYAEPDRLMQAFFMPNDPFYSEQWSYYESAAGIRLPAAWDGSTGAGVTVAVLDTGYLPHAELAGQILPGYDFISDSDISNDGDGRDADASDPGDAMLAGDCGINEPAQDQLASWHGTHVAGNIASLSNNSIGIAGVAFNAKILPARVLGKCGGYTSDIADAIVWASGGAIRGVPSNQNTARVINLSLGDSGECDRTTQAAINSARSRGAVIVVAAGNENRDASNSSPANCQGVIAVAAVDRSGARARYSNFGSAVSVAAPGGDISASVANGILSTLNAGLVAPSADSYAFYQGTSMAAPQVAGVVALMLSKNPNLSPDDVASKLMSSASPFPTNCPGCGAGIVNAAAALDATIDGAASSAQAVPAPVGNANQ